MQQIRGTDLTPQARAQALAMFVHRYTGDHTPDWVRREPDKYPLHFRDDADWLAHTFFWVTKTGRLAARRACISSPTFPFGAEVRS